MRRIEITLLGEPMSKQSVRKGKKGFYQPTKYKQKQKDYTFQIKQQLPKDFKMFTKRVHCLKYKVVHSQKDRPIKRSKTTVLRKRGIN